LCTGLAVALAISGLWLTCLADPGTLPASHEPGKAQRVAHITVLGCVRLACLLCISSAAWCPLQHLWHCLNTCMLQLLGVLCSSLSKAVGIWHQPFTNLRQLLLAALCQGPAEHQPSMHVLHDCRQQWHCRWWSHAGAASVDPMTLLHMWYNCSCRSSH
jgi:hypothetical protein